MAKRIIRSCGDRLRESDPHRWEGVPITFKTHWNNENDEFDIKTCILMHDQVEREVKASDPDARRRRASALWRGSRSAFDRAGAGHGRHVRGQI